VQYDTGVAPSIAIEGDLIVEVHQTTTGVGPLVSTAGTISDLGEISFGPDQQYDNGIAPSLSGSLIDGQGYEVHQATTGVGPLYSDHYGLTP
jgi:hypothetical protein